jgi:7-cyano-7-deazaguanine synthase
LLSGGIDSATTLALARQRGFLVHALTIDYGQRHSVEQTAARRVARQLGAVEHRFLTLDLRGFGGSALTNDIEVPKGTIPAGRDGPIPPTYVPARNTIFLSLALAWAEALGATDIFIGANAVDFSGYPDCRPVFIEAFERLARVGTRAGVQGAEIRIHAPLIHLTKAEIIREGLRLGVDYSLTHSCYDPPSECLACGRCESCQIRRKGFAEAGVPDPAHYAAVAEGSV